MTYSDLTIIRLALANEAQRLRNRRDMDGEKEVLGVLQQVTNEMLVAECAHE